MKTQSILFFFLLSFSAFSDCKTIRVAAIDWCPQICISEQEQGYIIDIVKEIYKNSGYQLDIQYYPWSRAIRNVSQGEADALLSPAKSEAPNFIYPEYEVGKQKMCFFTLRENQWEYQGESSLHGMQIGVAKDTSIEELNDYVKSHPQQFQFQQYHERYVIQNAKKLDKKRIDAFLFTKNSTIYMLKNANQWFKYKEAGCVSETKIYMAFSPAVHLKSIVAEMSDSFDDGMKKIKSSDFVEKLMSSYQLAN